MAGIYIPGMEMPQSCRTCAFRFLRLCVITEKQLEESEMFRVDKDCPLVAVPDHGRTVDATYVRDAIIDKWTKSNYDSFMYKRGMEDACEVVRTAPTILPTDEVKIK